MGMTPTWFMRDPIMRNDMYRAAQNNADATGNPQRIVVPTGQEETPWAEEAVVQPNPRRQFAGLSGHTLPWESL